MVDIARLGIAVDSAPVDKAEKSLDKLVGASARAQSAAKGVTTSMQLETAAVRANNAALQINAAHSKMAAFQQRNLAYQLNDVGVSLASGMNPLMVAIQQGAQISQIYGPDEGGIGRAFKETGKMIVGVLTKFPLVTAAVAGITAGFGLLTRAIREASGENVTFGDTAKATFSVISSAIYQEIKPAVDFMAGIFSKFLDWVAGAFKAVINGIIKGWQIAGEYISDAIAYIRFNFDSSSTREFRIQEILDADPAGDLFKKISGVAAGYARARDEAEGAGKAGKEAAEKIKEPWNLLGRTVAAANDNMREAKQVASGFLSELRSGMQEGKSFWESFRDAGINALNRISDKLFEVATNQLISGLFGSLLGGGGAGLAASNLGGSVIGGFAPSALFASGGYTGDAPRTAAAGIVHGQEYVVNADATARYRPMLEAMNTGAYQPESQSGGGISISIDARGAQKGVAEEIEARLQRFANNELYALQVQNHQTAVNRRAIR